MSKLIATRFKDEVSSVIEEASIHLKRTKSSIIKEAVREWVEDYLDLLTMEKAVAEAEGYISHEEAMKDV